MTDPGYPYPETDDLRSGPDLHPALLPLLPFVGTWRGTGKVGYPSITERDFAQEVRFSHDGRPFLAYESRAWLIDDEGRPVKPSAREVGWWRPGATDGELEVLLVHPTGVAEGYYGRVDGVRVELSSDAVLHTATAKDVTAMRRLYGIVDGDLMYAVDMAAMGLPLQAHLSARLVRVGG